MTRAFTQPCRGCNQGTINQKDYIITNSHWALSFDATTLNYDKREKVKIDILNGKIPDTITINNNLGEPNIYGFASITLLEPGHFVSAYYMPSRGEFVFYDGMPTTRIKKLHSLDLMDEDRKLYSVDYFRLK